MVLHASVHERAQHLAERGLGLGVGLVAGASVAVRVQMTVAVRVEHAILQLLVPFALEHGLALDVDGLVALRHSTAAPPPPSRNARSGRITRLEAAVRRTTCRYSASTCDIAARWSRGLRACGLPSNRATTATALSSRTAGRHPHGLHRSVHVWDLPPPLELPL